MYKEKRKVETPFPWRGPLRGKAFPQSLDAQKRPRDQGHFLVASNSDIVSTLPCGAITSEANL